VVLFRSLDPPITAPIASSSLCGARNFLGMIISNSQYNFLDTISPTITPPLGIPKTTLSFLSFSFFVTSFNASPKIFAAVALSLSFNWNLPLILSSMIYITKVMINL
jgi:hypothetical protein